MCLCPGPQSVWLQQYCRFQWAQVVPCPPQTVLTGLCGGSRQVCTLAFCLLACHACAGQLTTPLSNTYYQHKPCMSSWWKRPVVFHLMYVLLSEAAVPSEQHDCWGIWLTALSVEQAQASMAMGAGHSLQVFPCQCRCPMPDGVYRNQLIFDITIVMCRRCVYVRDLQALSHLTNLSILNLHLQRARGMAGQVTLRGLWGLVECSSQLSEIHLTGYMSTQLLVPGRVPGVGL